SRLPQPASRSSGVMYYGGHHPLFHHRQCIGFRRKGGNILWSPHTRRSVVAVVGTLMLTQGFTGHRPPATDHRPPSTDHRRPATDHHPPRGLPIRSDGNLHPPVPLPALLGIVGCYRFRLAIAVR